MKHDLTGQRFGMLVVVRQVLSLPKSKSTVRWLCQCDCGNTSETNGPTLTRGYSKSCGCYRTVSGKLNAHDLTGQVFGRLTALSRAPSARQWVTRWNCSCQCGASPVVAAGHLRHGKIQSCGCLKNEMAGARVRTHGKSKTATYKVWGGIIKRCTNPKSAHWKDYGGRGIAVCERWRLFENFLSDMGERPSPELTIERINNDGNYEPGNCRWATRLEQANNNRKCKPVSFRGQSVTVAALAREFGVHRTTIWQRLGKGMSVEQALGIAA